MRRGNGFKVIMKKKYNVEILILNLSRRFEELFVGADDGHLFICEKEDVKQQCAIVDGHMRHCEGLKV